MHIARKEILPTVREECSTMELCVDNIDFDLHQEGYFNIKED